MIVATSQLPVRESDTSANMKQDLRPDRPPDAPIEYPFLPLLNAIPELNCTTTWSGHFTATARGYAYFSLSPNII